MGDPRFEAITRRHTNHGTYDGRPLTAVDREALAGVTVDPGLRVDWIEDEHGRRALDDLVMRADALLFSRPDYRHELGQVIGSGAFGTPWLLATLGRFAVSHLLPSGLLSEVGSSSADQRSRARHHQRARGLTRGARCGSARCWSASTWKRRLRGVSLQPVSQLLRDRRDEGRPGAPSCPSPPGGRCSRSALGLRQAPRAHSPRRLAGGRAALKPAAKRHYDLQFRRPTCPTSCRHFPPARKSASRFPAASTRAPPCTGCAPRARSPSPTPPTSASPTRPDYDDIPQQGDGLRRGEGAADRMPRRSWSPRAWRPFSAAPSTSPPPAPPTSTPRRSAAPSPAPCSSSRCAKTT